MQRGRGWSAWWTLLEKGHGVVWGALRTSLSEVAGETLAVSGPSWTLQVISTWHLSLSLCPRGQPILSAEALSVRGDDCPVQQSVYSWISSLQLLILST